MTITVTVPEGTTGVPGVAGEADTALPVVAPLPIFTVPTVQGTGPVGDAVEFVVVTVYWLGTRSEL